MPRALLILLSGSLAFPCGADDVPVEEVLRVRWTAAYNSGDVEALGAMYAMDARLQQGYCPIVTGRDAIKAYWQGDMGEEGSTTTQLSVRDAFRAADLVYMSGTYSVEFADSAAEQRRVGGTYLQIWQRGKDSNWTILRETWTNLACADIRLAPGDGDAADAAGGPTA